MLLQWGVAGLTMLWRSRRWRWRSLTRRTSGWSVRELGICCRRSSPTTCWCFARWRPRRSHCPSPRQAQTRIPPAGRGGGRRRRCGRCRRGRRACGRLRLRGCGVWRLSRTQMLAARLTRQLLVLLTRLLPRRRRRAPTLRRLLCLWLAGETVGGSGLEVEGLWCGLPCRTIS